MKKTCIAHLTTDVLNLVFNTFNSFKTPALVGYYNTYYQHQYLSKLNTKQTNYQHLGCYRLRCVVCLFSKHIHVCKYGIAETIKQCKDKSNGVPMFVAFSSPLQQHSDMVVHLSIDISTRNIVSSIYTHLTQCRLYSDIYISCLIKELDKVDVGNL